MVVKMESSVLSYVGARTPTCFGFYFTLGARTPTCFGFYFILGARTPTYLLF